MEKALRKAKAALPRGGKQLAEELGISHQAVYAWKVCPVERAPDVERITGVPRHELRPDFWPPAAAARSSGRPARGKARRQ